MSRFDVDRFEVPPDAELVCCICQGVLDRPKETPCRHVFCQVCIETWLEKHRTCPTCRGTTTKSQLQNVLPLLQNMINRLKLRCGNHVNGCTESWMTEHHSEAHDDVCLFKKIKCRHRLCKRELIRKHLAKHESTCDFAEGVCPKYCGLTVFVKKMPFHSCLVELRTKVREQEGIIEENKKQIKQLEDEGKQLREQLQQQDDWGDDDYYSEEDNDWESWSTSNLSRTNGSNDNDSMVGFSENSEPYDPWDSTYRSSPLNYDVVYRASPTPTASSVSDPFEEEPERSPSQGSPFPSSPTAGNASDHTYYSYEASPYGAGGDELSPYSSDNQNSNYGSGADEGDRQNSQDDQNSQDGSRSWRSGSRTPVRSNDQGSVRTWSRSNSVLSVDDNSSSRHSRSNSDNDSNSSSSRVPNHGKFSHVNTSSSSESDSESAHDATKLNASQKLPNLCVSDDQVTSSGLVDNIGEESTSKNIHEKRSKKRKATSSGSESGAKQGSSKKVRRSDNGGSVRSGESSSTNHNDSVSDDNSSPRVRRSPRRPKPVENMKVIPVSSSDSSDSDTSYKTVRTPSDVTISDEHMTDELSDSEREVFETVDKLLDQYCGESDSNDSSWSPATQPVQ